MPLTAAQKWSGTRPLGTGQTHNGSSYQYRRATLPTADIDKLVAMSNSGLSIRQISYITGIPRSTVQDRVHPRHRVREVAPYYRFGGR